MRVIRRNQASNALETAQQFDGDATVERYATGEEGYVASHVTLPPGSSTHWHRHASGQVLYVTAGSGFVEEGDERTELSLGDVVMAAPGAHHRHGAARDETIGYFAVSREAGVFDS